MFSNPAWLWLLLPLAATAVRLRVRRPTSFTSLLLRILSMALVVTGMAGPRIGSGRPKAALLIDASLSQGQGADVWARAAGFRRLLSTRHDVDALLFADTVLPWRPDVAYRRTFPRQSTRFDRALAAASGADCVVIATDMRPLPLTHEPVPALDVPVFLLPCGPGADARIEDLRSPPWASKGAATPILVTLRSNADTNVTIRASLGRAEALKHKKLVAGIPETLRFVLPATGARAAHGKVIIDAPEDHLLVNNAWPFAVWLREPPEVLAVGDRTDSLAAAFEGVSPNASTLSPQEAETMITGGAKVPGVLVLEDLSPELTPRLLSVLPTLVGDGGVGVLFLGGRRSFGAGGLRPGHQAAGIIPAGLLPPGGKGVNVVVVLDCSGSMARPAAGFASKLGAVRRALLEGLAVLTGRDKVALVAFNQRAWKALEPAQYHPGVLQEAMSRLEAGGGTDISAGIVEAARLAKPQTGRTVFFLVSDGDPDRGEEGKSDALKAASALKHQRPGLRAVVVGTGENQDERFLNSLAEALDASAYRKASADDLREILVKEISNVRTEFISTQPQAPRPFQGHPLVRAEALPRVPVRNRLSLREGASTLFVCGDEKAPEPLAALMDYGAGRTALIAASSYQSGWLRERQAASLLKGLLAWLARDQALFASARYSQGRVTAVIDGLPASRRPHTLRVLLRPLDEQKQPISVRLLRLEGALYQGRLNGLEPGTYQLSAQAAGREILGFISLPFPEEYLRTGPDWPLIRRLETEGRLKVITEGELSGCLAEGRGEPSPWPFVLALLLFLLDLYLRRRPRPTG